MFELLFKYPASVFSRGTFVLLGSWPKWVLLLAILGAVATLAYFYLRNKQKWGRQKWARWFTLWAFQSAMVVLLLLLLWQPAISITALRPQQNIVAVVVDDSRSMSLNEKGQVRMEQAKEILRSSLMPKLRSRFQVRLYRMGATVERTADAGRLQGEESSTQIGRGLEQLATEAGTLPIGAVVLLSDGGDTSGGIDNDTFSALQRRHLPVSTIGFGETALDHDVELEGLSLPARTLPDSRLEAQVKIRQRGFSGDQTKLVIASGGKTLATRDIKLRDVPEQTETIEFHGGAAGVRTVEVRLDPLRGETNPDNNRRSQILSVDGVKRRILYVEGEPRWDYKFLRRAVEDDRAVAVVSMLRTTQNKIYRQGIANPGELADGFPNKAEDLFAYDAVILGSVEASFFNSNQQSLMESFVDRRGGGLLFLGGRAALADGGYNVSPFSALLPVTLPNRKNTFQRTFVAADLTEAGRNSLICRIEDTREKNNDHWEILPYLANFQDPGTPKPAATVLARVASGNARIPLLAIENYGRGRTGVFATGGAWRWRMQQPLTDKSEETFWRQLLRWTVTGSNGPVNASFTGNLQDDGSMQLRAEVRDHAYQLTGDADVQAHVVKPDGSAETVPLHAAPTTAGLYIADWNATVPGSYAAEITATRGAETLGHDVVPFRREDGAAENFHREQNRDLLTQLADQTGGRYYAASDAHRLPDEIAYSEAGITAREFKDLWDMPAIFLMLLILKSSEWMLRRRWGAV